MATNPDQDQAVRPGALVRFSSLAEENLEGEEEIRVLTRTDQDRPPLASPPLERRGLEG